MSIRLHIQFYDLSWDLIGLIVQRQKSIITVGTTCKMYVVNSCKPSYYVAKELEYANLQCQTGYKAFLKSKGGQSMIECYVQFMKWQHFVFVLVLVQVL